MGVHSMSGTGRLLVILTACTGLCMRHRLPAGVSSPSVTLVLTVVGRSLWLHGFVCAGYGCAGRIGGVNMSVPRLWGCSARQVVCAAAAILLSLAATRGCFWGGKLHPVFSSAL
jgi:hypothetical protein